MNGGFHSISPKQKNARQRSACTGLVRQRLLCGNDQNIYKLSSLMLSPCVVQRSARRVARTHQIVAKFSNFLQQLLAHVLGHRRYVAARGHACWQATTATLHGRYLQLAGSEMASMISSTVMSMPLALITSGSSSARWRQRESAGALFAALHAPRQSCLVASRQPDSTSCLLSSSRNLHRNNMRVHKQTQQ